MTKWLADFFNISPIGGSMMMSADVGTFVWRDRFGRHWIWKNKRWIRSTEFRGWGPD